MVLPGRRHHNNIEFPSDSSFDSGFHLAKRGAGAIGCFIFVQWLVGLAFTGAVIAVAWHFIAKYW